MNVDQSTQVQNIPASSPDPSFAALLQAANARSIQSAAGLNTQPLAQNAGTSNSSNGIPSADSTQIVQPTVDQQAPKWQVAPQMNGGVAQKRASTGALIQNIQGLVQTAAANKQRRDISTATNDWNRLMTAMQNPNDPQNQTVIQDILGDPKKLKLMSKALNVDWLNPNKGADNVYRQALGQAMAKHQLKAGALSKLKDMLLGQGQNVNLTSDQSKELAAQMEARFPKQPQQAAQLKDQMMAKVYNKIINDPRGVGAAIAAMPKEEQQLLGIGPSANAELRAEVDQQIQQMKDADKAAQLQQKSVEFAQTLNEKIQSRTQRASEFAATQKRLTDSAKMNFIFKAKDLQQRIASTQVQSQRLELQNQLADLTSKQTQFKGYNDQITSIDKQISILTTKERNIETANKTQSSGLSAIFSKDIGVTDAGQAQIQDVENQISTLNKQKTDLLAKQNSLMDSISLSSDTTQAQSPDKTSTTPTAKPTKVTNAGALSASDIAAALAK